MLLAQMKFLTIDLSVIIALIALCYAIREIRRSNNIIIKIKECSSGLQNSIYENNTQAFFYFKVMIQNKGVSLYCPKMSLSFNLEEGGTVTLPLKQEKQIDFSVDTFSKGMVTIYHFKTYELNKGDLSFLNEMSSASKQNACLCLYSQSYLAKTFPINCFVDRMKQKWNRFSYKLSFSRKKGENWEGKDILKHYQLPTFQTLGDKIELFINNCNEQSINKLRETNGKESSK